MSKKAAELVPYSPDCLVITMYDYSEGFALMLPRFFIGISSVISYGSPFGKELIKNKCSTVNIVDQAISDMIFGDSHKT